MRFHDARGYNSKFINERVCALSPARHWNSNKRGHMYASTVTRTPGCWYSWQFNNYHCSHERGSIRNSVESPRRQTSPASLYSRHKARTPGKERRLGRTDTGQGREKFFQGSSEILRISLKRPHKIFNRRWIWKKECLMTRPKWNHSLSLSLSWGRLPKVPRLMQPSLNTRFHEIPNR